MTARFIILSLIITRIPLRASEDAFNPFSSVIRRGDIIVATLSPNHRWVVAVGYGHYRDALDAESFPLTDGEWLWLAEPPHPTGAIYRLRCQLSPIPAGLRVENRFDARTFGDIRVKKSYFIEAQ